MEGREGDKEGLQQRRGGRREVEWQSARVMVEVEMEVVEVEEKGERGVMEGRRWKGV